MVIEAGLRGALLLARGRPEGLMLIEAGPGGVARSFWAAALCLPGFLALRLFAWAEVGPASLGRGLTAELLGYACTWAGFALATLPLAEASGRKAEWPQFIAAWNWANVVQYLVLLALTVPASLGLPPLLAHGLGLAALGYALWLEWFVAKSALRIAGGRAAAFVLLDLALGIFVGGLVARLTEG
ncbi:hypothetical protein ACFQY5_10190 [Paeniroseomonas aquatica]|uniref:Uncharacterized protein n=1 Tax=Paeniroseomonas aquatica TaxID=373043 RepID=A0ABT8A843_9PROT|nr:hypothetical protein [Paeniroseomonas aquatica]MDN3565932.1 hypothetical protein [Paeniroseomonas aquatica]